MHILAIQHEASTGPGRFGPWWGDAGAEVAVVEAWREPLPGLAGCDALCVLGGSMDCDDDAAHPWLPGTRHLIREAIAADVPFLGLCLGSQLATVALGGEIGRRREMALGVTPITWTNAKADDPLMAAMPDQVVALHYNSDQVTRSAPDAVTLAETPDGQIQVQRYADRAWGVQFHPELDAATWRAWTVDHAEPQPTPPSGRTLAGIAAEVDAAEETLLGTWRRLALRFLECADA